MAFQDTRHPVVEPVVSERSDHGTASTHPAFGQISVQRVSGSAALYGSDFMHSGFVRIRIFESEHRRDLSRDWHYAGRELIAVDLSEAQWATFVSSMNVGEGVPCTLDTIQGEPVPSLPPPASRTEQFAGEMAEHVEDAIREIDEVLAKLPQKGEAASKLRRARMQLHANLPHIAGSFDKHMERTVEKAKVEIHGYINSAVARAGLATLGGPDEPLISLPGKDAE